MQWLLTCNNLQLILMLHVASYYMFVYAHVCVCAAQETRIMNAVG